jgi:hypothetical protein
VGFHRIEDHEVTLLTVTSWKEDLVSIKYISSVLWISEIYITHKKLESYAKEIWIFALKNFWSLDTICRAKLRLCNGNQRCEYTSLWKPNSFLKPVQWVSTVLKTMGWLCWPVTSWTGDLVSIKYISSVLWISEIYITHKKHKMPVADWKTFKIYGKIWLWKKKITRISYQKAHHVPASCVLCKFLRFIEKKKYIF